MFTAAAIDFPFVAELPKRKQSRVLKAWDLIEAMRAVPDEKGLLIPMRIAAKVLGVSTQRVSQLVDAGKLEAVVIDEHPLVTEQSLIEWAKSEKKAGRPLKAVTMKDAIQAGQDFLRGK